MFVIEIIHGIYISASNAIRLNHIYRYPSSRELRKRPTVDVVVYAGDNIAQIAKCLDSIRQSNYKKLKITVLYYGKRSKVREYLQDYSACYPKIDLRVVNCRKMPDFTSLSARHAGWPRDITLRLHSAYTVERTAIRYAVEYFAKRPDVRKISPHETADFERSVPSLLRIGVRALHLPSQHISRGRAGVIFERTASNDHSIGAKIAHPDHILVTDQRGLVALTLKPLPSLHASGRSSPLELLAHSIRSVILVSEPIALGYFIFLAQTISKPEYFIGAWVFGVLSLLLHPKLYSPSQTKVRLVLLAPVIYALELVYRSVRLATFILAFVVAPRSALARSPL